MDFEAARQSLFLSDKTTPFVASLLWSPSVGSKCVWWDIRQAIGNTAPQPKHIKSLGESYRWFADVAQTYTNFNLRRVDELNITTVRAYNDGLNWIYELERISNIIFSILLDNDSDITELSALFKLAKIRGERPAFLFYDKPIDTQVNTTALKPLEKLAPRSDDLLNAYLASLDCPQFLKDNIHDFTLLTLKAYEAAQCGIAERYGKSADLKGYLQNRLEITSEQSRVLYSLTKEPKKEP